MKICIAAAVLIAIGGVAAAQHHGGEHHQTHSPYAGQEQRSVKALSDQQTEDLRAGRGMGLALAAELNGYPGPRHVIELADRLELTGEQRQRMRELYDAMKAEAVSVGEKLIEDEAALDRAFAAQTISPSTLEALTAQIGKTQGRLRAVHLKYHLTTAALLSVHQKHRYTALRGYR
jgi:Spy/CpxP family protein refolding chaperone